VTKRVALNETKEKGRKGKRTGLMEINEKKGKEEKKKRISPRSPSLSVGCLYSMEINNRNCERRIPRSNSPIEFAN
jgi:retron-type reverse transcriptase